MRLAVLSDSHDNIWKLAAAMPHLAAADAVLHCGDLCSPFMIRRMGDGLPGKPIHVVWGNNDGDPFLIARNAREYASITLHGELAEFELDGVRIAANHYPAIARGLAGSGKYDIVCYGHDHSMHHEMVGATLLLNPGELMGMNGRSTIALVDGATRRVEIIEV